MSELFSVLLGGFLVQRFLALVHKSWREGSWGRIRSASWALIPVVLACMYFYAGAFYQPFGFVGFAWAALAAYLFDTAVTRK